MSTATTTSHDTGQHTTSRATNQPSNTPTTQFERSAAQRLRTTFVPVRLAFTWLGARKTLAPEQRTTAARAFHADRELLSASKLIHATWADMGPVGERVLGPFRNRTEALWAEGVWLVSQIVEAASNQRLPGTAPDTSALLAAFEANRCRSGLAYR